MGFLQTGAQFEAFFWALDILVTGMFLAWVHTPAGKIWVEKVKLQLRASLTTTVPQGKGLNFPHIALVQLLIGQQQRMITAHNREMKSKHV